MAKAVIKINLPEDKQGFFCRTPRRIGKKGQRISPSARAIAGKIYGTTVKTDSHVGCWLSYDQIQREFGICRETVATALSMLENAGIIQQHQRDRAGTAFRYVGDAGRTYDVVPQYLYTADIMIGGTSYRLTKAQVSILSHIITESKRPKNNGVYEGSMAQLARTLKLSETTVKKGVKVLLKANLIHRSAEDKGVNAYKRTVYHVDSIIWDLERKLKRKKRAAVAKGSKDIIDTDSRAARKRYYDLAMDQARARADKYKMQVYKAVPEFKDLNAKIQALAFPLAEAEHRKLDTLTSLKETERKYQEARKQIMQRFNIKEERLNATYYARCKRCFDTGAKSDGTLCDCFKEHL